MNRRLRIGVAALNESQPGVAAMLWRDLEDDVALKELANGEHTEPVAIETHEISRRKTADDDVVFAFDEETLTVEDLTIEELVYGVQEFVPVTGSPSAGLKHLPDIVAETDSEVGRTRLRLLLEDILFDPVARAVAVDRLTQLLDRHHHERRDVSELFEG